MILRDFLSHADTDLSLDGAKLVCLTGPNGAGKSALISDALSYALWDSARGRADDLVRLGSSDMSVLVEFAFAGARYRVTRGRTTRAGGKSFLELAIASSDGATWLPLSGASIRETQERIGELLRLDESTWATAVLLGQGEADRFAAATPAERKRVLVAVLGLGVWDLAEAIARERARDTDAALAAGRAAQAQLEAEAETLADAPERLATAERDLDAIARLAERASAERASAEALLVELAARLAAAEAAQVEADRWEAELAAHKERWRRASEAHGVAGGAIARAQAALERASEVEAAAAALPEARARLVGLALAEGRHQEAERALADAERALREVVVEHAAAVHEHEAGVARLADRVAALEQQVAALEPVTCPTCGARFAADPADLAGRLAVARAELAAVGEPPDEPPAVARARAGVVRARATLDEAPPPGPELEEARAELLALERTAAAAGEIEAQRAALADARSHMAGATDEMANIERAGKEARAALADARVRIAQGEPLLAQRADALSGRDAAIETLDGLATRRDAAGGAQARAAADLERADALAARIETARSAIAGREQDLARLRRLAEAFGVRGIPARIIESVLPELAGHINEILGELRPGMSLELRAQRAKKSSAGIIEALDLVVRDAAGERPLGLYSGGERMSVSLAIAVGLSRLVARRAGSRIASLVIDEPDGLDLDSRRALGHALKVLAHQRELERIVVVTHTPDLAEYGDSVFAISKDASGSHVELVA